MYGVDRWLSKTELGLQTYSVKKAAFSSFFDNRKKVFIMNEKFMLRALKLAKEAYDLNEVPVGAVIVKNGEIVSEGRNMCEALKNPLKHAEIIAIERACISLGDKYLDDCEIYVTLEPCAMCAGAIINARIGKLYFGAFEKESGACGSSINLFLSTSAYKKTDVFPGILQEECSRLMSSFFKEVLR